jgi:hypothetical protein
MAVEKLEVYTLQGIDVIQLKWLKRGVGQELL